MKKGIVAVMVCLAILGCTLTAWAEDLAIKDGDTLVSMLEGQKGKKVTLRLGTGEELTGLVRNITKNLVQLGELAGKEYFDAIVDVNKISAIIIRVKTVQ